MTDAHQADPAELGIKELGFSPRTFNRLKREDIHTAGDLASCTEQDLADIRDFGPKTIEVVRQKLATLGLALSTGRGRGGAADGWSLHTCNFVAIAVQHGNDVRTSNQTVVLMRCTDCSRFRTERLDGRWSLEQFPIDGIEGQHHD